MKIFKKTLSVFLAMLMMISALSVGLYGYAEDLELNTIYRALALDFFTCSQEGRRTIIRDDNGYPVLSNVGKTENYQEKNESDEYKYADSNNKPIRAIAYEHTVTAKDDTKHKIRDALTNYLAIANQIMSTEYGVGLYTMPMLIDEIKKNVRLAKDYDNNYIFLDGYTYLVNTRGELIGRSEDPTYEVVNGEVRYFVEEESGGINWEEILGGNFSGIRDSIREGIVREMTLYDYANCDLILNYFGGNFTSVNSGNWFHKYKFRVTTDVNTVLITEEFTPSNFIVTDKEIEWTMSRKFDESGTKPYYYNNGYATTIDTSYYSTIREGLNILKSDLQAHFNKYYAPDYLKTMKNAALIDNISTAAVDDGCYADIITSLDDFNSISNEAKIAVFGQEAYSYINLVTQLTPIVGKNYAQLDKYMPVHTYEKYTDNGGNNVQYKVTTDKVTTIVDKIDALLTSERVGSIVKLFLDFNDPKYEGMSFYGQAVSTPKEILYQLIQYYLFSDNIINLVLTKLYPVVTNLLDENVTDDLINDNVPDALTGLLWNILRGKSLAFLINECIWNIGVGLTPAGVAAVWNRYGYLDAAKNPQYYQLFRANHDILRAAEGGEFPVTVNGTQYWALGSQWINDARPNVHYIYNRWGNVDADQLYWGINGDRQKFQMILAGSLAPLMPLLAVLLGKVKSEIKVNTTLGDLYLVLENFDLYDDVLLPILESLQIPNLTPSNEYRAAAEAIRTDDSRNPTTNKVFLDKLLDPIINWVQEYILDDPITIIATLVPNLSYMLTNGLVKGVLNKVQVPIKIKAAILFGATITITTLNVASMIGDAIDFLDSLQGVLDLVGLKVKTGIPIIGYKVEDDSVDAVYAPGMPGYNAGTMTVPVAEAYRSPSGAMRTYPNEEYTEKVVGKTESGEYTEYIILDDVGWRNDAGYVVTQRNDSTATPEEYHTAVKEYYQYDVYDEETETTFTYRTTFAPAEGVEYTLVRSIREMTENATLPCIMDYKLQACGEVKTISSLREDPLTVTNSEGVTTTWNAGQRNHIDMHVYGEESEGLVLLFIFRYLFSALNYRSYNGTDFDSNYTLLDAFGLGDTLEKELVAGLKLSSIINNITLNPDAAIAALYELFYKNEFGSIYKILNGSVVDAGRDYTYDIEYVDYHNREILNYAQENNDYEYGASVVYSQYWSKDNAEYVVDNLDELVDNVFAMLKLENISSISEFLENLLNDKLFNNEMLSKIAALIFTAIDNLSIDLGTILGAALDVDYSKAAIARALRYMFGTNSQMSLHLDSEYNRDLYKYTEESFYFTETDPDSLEEIKTPIDWGFNDEAINTRFTSREIFIRAISALASPFAVIVQYLFCGEDLSLLGLINLPGYEIYHYAWIPFMEALGATTDLINFRDFYGKVFNNISYEGSNVTAGNCDAFYYAFIPAFKFVENVIANPVETLLQLIPNLMFFISIGGLNGVINNFLHFAYVLLDILQPVVDVYPILNGLLSNIRIGNFALNISIPLDLDVNHLVSDLVDGLLGTMLSFDIKNKNIVLGQEPYTEEVVRPVLDEFGQEQYNENNELITETVTESGVRDVYAVGTLNITLPPIDLSTLCAGTIAEKTSISGERIIVLNAAGGADLITTVLRLVVDTLFYADNAENIGNFLIGFCQLDDEDNNDEFLMEIFTYLNDEANKNEFPDKTLWLLFNIYKLLVPIADNLGGRFKNVDFSIIELFNGMSNSELTKDRISKLLSAGDSDNPTMSIFARLIQMIKDFFAKLREFFQKVFGGA